MAEGEALLLARYARGQDADAFRALVEAHQHMVYAACHRVLQNSADAQDAAQECFFRLAQKAGELTAPIAGWLHTVAVHRAIDMLRGRRARRAHEAKALPRTASEAPSWEHIRGRVDEQIASLPERLRVPIVLYYLEGRTQEDIAAELAVSGAGAAAGLGAGQAALLAAVTVGALLGVVWLAVWGAVTWATGRSDEPAEHLAAYAAAPVPSPAAGADGGVIERVLAGDTAGTDMFIDLDTGEVRSMPPDVVEIPAVLAWMRRTGTDALYSKMMSARSLIGADLAAVRVPDGVWNRAVEHGMASLAVPPPAGHAFPVYLEARPGRPATFCVRTREGGAALLQIIDIERGAEGGMRIRSMVQPRRPDSGA